MSTDGSTDGLIAALDKVNRRLYGVDVRAELAEVRGRHDQLIEDLCALIPEEAGDDTAVEAIIVRWFRSLTAEHDGCATNAGRILTERDRYRAALKSIVLGHTMCGCTEVPAIAREALNPPAAETRTARDGSRLLPCSCSPMERCTSCADALVPVEDDPRIDRAEDERRDPERTCGCVVSVQLDGSDRCDACGGWVSS